MFALAIAVAVAMQSVPTAFTSGSGVANLPATEDAPRVHDPSTIVHDKDEYWLFATGPGVRSFHSAHLMRWLPGPPVLPSPPAWTHDVASDNRGYFWAPDVVRVNDRYLLYYSVSTWGKKTSAIGLATTRALGSNWRDEGIVVRSNTNDDFNAIDPSVLLDTDGRLWMAFGSYWSGIKLVELDPVTGKRLACNAPMVSLARHDSLEAACLYHHDSFYYLFVNWGQCCRGTNSTYEIRVGRSVAVTGPFVDRDGIDMLQGGGTRFLGTSGSFVGPGHAGILRVGKEEWLSCHFYDGNRGGRPTLALRKLGWSKEGWPK